ncbi:hypothetical protein [Plantibacter sp. CFBP 13570]|uniref:hypothetical protein n=1 Tax=Plantibacter sp. CFBP 13570 TaxID=2775272 RepID=UPI001930BCE6|nr:hypothetical protein [Plantibacter sp. CFBP 13570]MBD8534549.1 hypothetical protein [Plantibacter sp. CFBP 13570]
MPVEKLILTAEEAAASLGWAVPRATTSRGSLRRPLTALKLWAERHIDEDLEARDAFDERGLEEATSAL